MRIERIDSLDDPRVGLYRNVKDGDLASRVASGVGSGAAANLPGAGGGPAAAGAGEVGRFMAEGELVLRRLIDSPYSVESALVSDKRLAGLTDALEGLPAGTPVYVADQRLMDQIVGFHIHRGVLAVGGRGEAEGAEALLTRLASGERMVLVLETIANHDNMGSLFRNAAALGADAVLLTPRCCDPMWRKSIRVSMGTVLRTPFAWIDEAPACVERLRGAGFTTVALTPAADAIDIAEFGWTRPELGRVALLVGAEGPGLSSEALSASDFRARVPMAPGVDSLNVATAAAIAMHAMRSAREHRRG